MATRFWSRARWLLAAFVALSLLSLVQGQGQGQADAGSPVAAAPPSVVTDGETTTITGAVTGTDTLQTGRITRDGRIHGCETPTAMPPLNNATPLRSDAIVLQNTHPEDRCIVVEADFTGCAGQSTQVNAYSAYSAAAPASGVIGAAGFSSIAELVFGFRVGPNASYTLVVHEVTAGTGCPAYSLKVTNTPLAATFTSGVGTNAAAITPTVDAFRAALGSGRQEITWEDVPESAADPQNLPLDRYNTTQPRGLVFTAPTQVRASSDGTSAPAEFGSFNAGNQARYQPFSGVRLFSPVNATTADVSFRVAGTPTPAPTSAFGAVLVSPGNSAFLLPRDAVGDPLGIYVAPAQANGLGFYGLRFATPQIHTMTMSGDFGFGVANATVFDDFIYADPGMPLSLTATGPGAVSGTGIQCPGDCVQSYAIGATVNLTAAPSGLAGFGGWGGACAGTSGKTCALTMSEARAATATFVDCAPQDAAVTKAKKAVKKAKKAVKKAKKAVEDADTAAELSQAQGKLAKAKKKLKKAKKKVKTTDAALRDCLG